MQTLSTVSQGEITGRETKYVRETWDLTYGGDGRRYAGSSGDLGREVAISMTVVSSCIVRAIVTVSLGLEQPQQAILNEDSRTYFAGHPNVKLVLVIRVS